MDFIGRMLTVLIFVMSIVFMSFSVMVFATHKNWKEASIGLQREVQDQRTKNQDLERQKSEILRDYAAEQVARASALGALQTELEQLRAQINQKENEVATLQSQKSTMEATLATTEKNHETLLKEINEQRELIVKTRKEADSLFIDVVNKTDELNQAKDQERNLVERNESLTEQYSALKLVADKKGIGPNTLVEEIPPPIDAVVLAVGEKDLVEISIGSDDGVRKGHSMEAFRGTTYLGRIVILKTEPNKSIAKILPDLRKAPIKKGDRVTTRLS